MRCGMTPGSRLPSDSVLHIFHHCILYPHARQVHHTGAVLPGHNFFGVVIQVLTNHGGRLCGREEVAGTGKLAFAASETSPDIFLPQITKLVTRIPDVVTRRVDGVRLGRRIVARCPAPMGRQYQTDPRKYRWDSQNLAGSVKVAGGGYCCCVGELGSAQSGTSGVGRAGAARATNQCGNIQEHYSQQRSQAQIFGGGAKGTKSHGEQASR